MKIVKLPVRKIKKLEDQLSEVAQRLCTRDGPIVAYHKVAALAEKMRKEIEPPGK